MRLVILLPPYTAYTAASPLKAVTLNSQLRKDKLVVSAQPNKTRHINFDKERAKMCGLKKKRRKEDNSLLLGRGGCV